MESDPVERTELNPADDDVADIGTRVRVRGTQEDNIRDRKEIDQRLDELESEIREMRKGYEEECRLRGVKPYAPVSMSEFVVRDLDRKLKEHNKAKRAEEEATDTIIDADEYAQVELPKSFLLFVSYLLALCAPIPLFESFAQRLPFAFMFGTLLFIFLLKRD
uniref:Uncharacterized protein n=1 Tax=Mucochytrium quahogii TaxID=96639 RepID=A0A7S2W3I6_9STRA|mmetsp:Transcript_19640/g.32290  ORF Transcript_19640/g.32290 Transcript_19640/m.32290 type:complete len:163 (-) Transcript_19640:52-540(-)|eukprot:CAMPEP_0203800236 /NCGR_PEP_ID=MMETSP0100_2-20121128/10414_1 /ASSEMBLY_ACC=CAM_ASM_000210 /TAXON_ID=96639 /ORGANISM=" , Strain NY0313808BC1" /LENGTH=162 /DNA_ID=CAMNT_0050706315 /DNA_START=507 /DNA_END=995 /DNA_ORIENTATION=+